MASFSRASKERPERPGTTNHEGARQGIKTINVKERWQRLERESEKSRVEEGGKETRGFGVTAGVEETEVVSVARGVQLVDELRSRVANEGTFKPIDGVKMSSSKTTPTYLHEETCRREWSLRVRGGEGGATARPKTMTSVFVSLATMKFRALHFSNRWRWCWRPAREMMRAMSSASLSCGMGVKFKRGSSGWKGKTDQRGRG